ncbi:Fructoselysine-6-P-deglycase FrlB with duplicated sugar isomerase (SIS) domain [Leifsonia sp. 98AMF]|nr:Fructoselysine-6-P-deglycase FrlB with duplicated sugar isomerase (SIS) domain [Leifsonia sp. 197AMF]SDI83934.1 Fructoselysine-6-P-deglycase FrlB with duplicated sugar isomerase (SIS) domain [Leifsonia sp. 466MF]SDJ99384.1 Fructoselysine-6-P-deglycase FrlB with duplicated sugar isomerase (SIS) domain [Leifsonia sp. 157MF]SDN87207.1 Fructoselysine-6-P-deglycase FrlB with duplicated sugar isomerase (SIS) domain [Leifsonia sp. 509MF]SEN18939.1 Fructoselysine-6-P-deglycase FrlB with duplicated s
MTHAPTAGAHMEAELRSQPETWATAAGLREEQSLLPAAGERIAVVGCGTSWFMAQSYAVLRESAGHGVTDAFAASEAFVDRDYDAVVAITRSGTTTEVLELLDGLRSSGNRARTVGIVGDPDTPLVSLVDVAIRLPFADEQSVVQTRFATTALALVRASLGHDLSPAIDQAAAAIEEELDDELVTADQYSFLGAGWTVGLAHEAALKMREASQSWTESYPAKEYRHGPIAIAAPGRVTWMLGEAPAGLSGDLAVTGARFEDRPIDGMADLVRAQRVALARARRAGLDPDSPRNLTRSVILPS